MGRGHVSLLSNLDTRSEPFTDIWYLLIYYRQVDDVLQPPNQASAARAMFLTGMLAQGGQRGAARPPWPRDGI